MSEHLSRREFLKRMGLAGIPLAVGTACAAPTAPPPRAADTPAAAIAASLSTAAPRAPMTVRMGTLRVLAEAGLYFALERGLFQQQGLSIETVDVGSEAEVIPSLVSGQLHMIAASMNAGILNAVARGLPIKMVAPGLAHQADASAIFLLVRSDLRQQIQAYQDLAGRRLAITTRGAFLHYLAALALERGGLQPRDVELVELGLPEINAALANGAVDLAFQVEPLATLAVEHGIAAKWRAAGQLRPGVQGGGLFFSPALLGDQAEIGRAWMVAYLQGVRAYARALRQPGGREVIARVLGAHTAVRERALYHRMALGTLDPNGQIDEASLGEQVAWYVGQGLVPATTDVRAALDTSFTRYAVEQLGRYS
jgi:NitT/TauT family transport system substrate-binding protein